MIERKQYLNQLISKKENGLIKVITGIRRCGKSYLLFNIYRDYLLSIGINKENIIELALDDDEFIQYRNPIELGKYLRSKLVDENSMYYIFLDEIQKVKTIENPYLENDFIGFVDVLLGLMKKKNADIYVTGSNSKMLSSDILTEFRGRGDEIHVYPLSYEEFYNSYKGEKHNAWRDYYTYGGMPYITTLDDHQKKSQYLNGLFENIYILDILERHKIRDKTNLDNILDIISSSIGSLTNPQKISDTFLSVTKTNICPDTINKYLDYFIDAFMIEKAKRFDIKGRKYIGSPYKYYFSDIGLRNARLNFRQTEENHIMENIIYNELKIRGLNVDIGNVEYNYKDENGNSKKTTIEVDFVVTDGNKKIYIQSTLNIDENSKRLQEIRPYMYINDSFKKIVIIKDNIIPWYDEYGILYIGIEEFLLNKNSHNL